MKLATLIIITIPIILITNMITQKSQFSKDHMEITDMKNILTETTILQDIS